MGKLKEPDFLEEASASEMQSGFPCRVASVASLLDPIHLAQFQAAMSSDVSSAAIARVAKRRGWKTEKGAYLSEGVVQRHRRRDCRCW